MPNSHMSFCTATCLGVLSLLGVVQGQAAEGKNYGPGVTDTEIKLGQTMPYSGPASGLGVQGLTDVAYFRMVNERGGINGRKVNLISLDDGYSPPRAVEQTRKLIEDDQVFAMFHSLGTPTNSATYKYVNAQKVPDLFIVTGAEKFRDPVVAPWTTTIVHALHERGKGIRAPHTQYKSAGENQCAVSERRFWA